MYIVDKDYENRSYSSHVGKSKGLKDWNLIVKSEEVNIEMEI